jgi:glycosyltransferase involved in cell wall biosynthesis
MRVLVLAPQPFFQERGTPIAVRLLLELLSQAGHQVEALVYHEGEDPRLPGVVIHRIPAPWGVRGVRPGFSGKKLVCDAVMAAQALGLARGRRFDLIHAVEEAAFMALGIKALLGIPYVYDMDSSLATQVLDKLPRLGPLGGLLRRAEGLALRHSLGVLAVCRALRHQAKEQAAPGPVVCLEDISLLGQAAEDEPPAEVAALNGLKVMYVGNLEPYQGLDLLLEGFGLALAGAPALNLVVIGGAAEDIAKYQAKAQALGLAGRAHFLGPRPSAQLGPYLAAADIVVSPRMAGENTPMKIYSYLDSGKPVLATRLATHTQVLDDRVAMLVEPTPADLARGLGLLAGDAELRRELGGQGRRRVRQRFSRQAYQRKLLAFYAALERALGKGRATGERAR